jgi:hypothetical protein
LWGFYLLHILLHKMVFQWLKHQHSTVVVLALGNLLLTIFGLLCNPSQVNYPNNYHKHYRVCALSSLGVEYDLFSWVPRKYISEENTWMWVYIFGVLISRLIRYCFPVNRDKQELFIVSSSNLLIGIQLRLLPWTYEKK